jgi:signal transduction histidine kinase
LRFWRGFSIASKLYLVTGTMAVLIACELLTLRFAMRTLSAVRAFVDGEGHWSKAQKDAAFSLQRYALTRDESDYQRFLERLKIPEGDRRARLELMKASPDLAVVRSGFIQGQVHPDDIDAMVELLRRFHKVSYLERAIQAWTEGDKLMEEFRLAGNRYHDLLSAPVPDVAAIREVRDTIQRLNLGLHDVEVEFSAALGAGSRWMEGVVISLLFFAVLLVETTGIALTFRTTRALKRGLDEANAAAARIGKGDFAEALPVRSDDEIGQLARSINQMRALLERSYRDLESRVAQRTAELEALAKENARLYSEAAAAVEMRDEFFSIASHELRTPLTALNLQLQLFSRKVTDPGVAEVMESCLRQSRRLAKLSAELMDLTHIRLGKLQIQSEPCDLAAVVRDVALAMEPEASKASSPIELDAHDPVVGRFDPARVAQIATNLLSNAIKYGRSKPIRIRVSREGSDAVIQVTDQGQGIAPEDQARVFERFERVGGKEPRVSGLGLGLYITRQIVEKHGGRIRVESRLGEGATFTVEMPLNG